MLPEPRTLYPPFPPGSAQLCIPLLTHSSSTSFPGSVAHSILYCNLHNLGFFTLGPDPYIPPSRAGRWGWQGTAVPESKREPQKLKEGEKPTPTQKLWAGS